MRQPLRVINSAAPIRICDNGGWTDTWFAKHGQVFNIAVCPDVEVQIEAFPYEPGKDQVVLYAENYGDRYAVRSDADHWGPHPLLEAAIHHIGVPPEYAIQATIFSRVPGGCSTGTSAAVTVALIGALDRLRSGSLRPHEIAYAAHSVEVEMLKQQSGIQDQLCAAYGGINYIQITCYPHASITQIQVAEAFAHDLEKRLALVYLGKAHSSSQVHERIIAELENEGPDSKRLQDLRLAAEKSRDAACAGDLAALGRAMIENTEAQGRLHPYLVSADAQHVIKIAREFGALGWKVNGAGGEGGSVTILGPAISCTQREMLRAIEGANALFQNIPIHLSRYGLRTWECKPTSNCCRE